MWNRGKVDHYSVILNEISARNLRQKDKLHRERIAHETELLNKQLEVVDRVDISKNEYLQLLDENRRLKEYVKANEEFQNKLSDLFKQNYNLLFKSKSVEVYVEDNPRNFERKINVQFTIDNNDVIKNTYI